MSRIELPATDADMQDLVERYGPTATMIGLNQVRTARLALFIREFVDKDAEPIEAVVDGRKESYTQKFTSAVTLGGMMIHARLHRLPHTVTEENQYLLVTDSLFDTEPEQLWLAGSTQRPIGRTTSEQTEITASRFYGYGPGLRSVEEEDEPTDEVERLFERALGKTGLPQMSYGDAGWRYRVGPDMYEGMAHIRTVQANVAALREERAGLTRREEVIEPAAFAPTGSDQRLTYKAKSVRITICNETTVPDSFPLS